ncbi:hypothetical protein ACFQBQ_17010 [Granulicella cerasi]|uniref:Uncharacterized protein n=1 Tax=Granulicella cerasi TaxID=741063 RepID=A0ABW1ZE14_9BACT
MNSHHHLLDDDDDLMPGRERELTLSTGTILAIFFGLVLVCGLFFAFGYNLGKKATVPQFTASGDDNSGSGAQFNNFKPSAGSPSGSSAVAAKNSTPLATSTPAPVAAPKPAPVAQNDAPVAETPRVAEAAPAEPKPTPVHREQRMLRHALLPLRRCLQQRLVEALSCRSQRCRIAVTRTCSSMRCAAVGTLSTLARSRPTT